MDKGWGLNSQTAKGVAAVAERALTVGCDLLTGTPGASAIVPPSVTAGCQMLKAYHLGKERPKPLAERPKKEARILPDPPKKKKKKRKLAKLAPDAAVVPLRH